MNIKWGAMPNITLGFIVNKIFEDLEKSPGLFYTFQINIKKESKN